MTRRGRLTIRTDGVVSRKGATLRPHIEVVGMDVFAHTDRPGREANDLVVPQHGLAFRNVAHSNFVARRDHATHGDITELLPAQQLLTSDQDVVCGM